MPESSLTNMKTPAFYFKKIYKFYQAKFEQESIVSSFLVEWP